MPLQRPSLILHNSRFNIRCNVVFTRHYRLLSGIGHYVCRISCLNNLCLARHRILLPQQSRIKKLLLTPRNPSCRNDKSLSTQVLYGQPRVSNVLIQSRRTTTIQTELPYLGLEFSLFLSNTKKSHTVLNLYPNCRAPRIANPFVETSASFPLKPLPNSYATAERSAQYPFDTNLVITKISAKEHCEI